MGVSGTGPRADEGFLYLIADDELELRVLTLEGAPVLRVPLLAGALPAEPAELKRAKPDLECVAALGAGELLILGSGSKVSRTRGVLLDLAAGPRAVDLGPLYSTLAEQIPELNIEGAALCGATLRLLQRGNGPSGVNAVVDLELKGVREALANGWPLDGFLIQAVHRVELGDLQGVRLGFTDAASLPDGRLLFSAAAEAGKDTYQDGPCAGSVLGVLDAQARVDWIEPLEGRAKIEGVHVRATGEALLVDDPDDRSRRASLWSARLPI